LTRALERVLELHRRGARHKWYGHHIWAARAANAAPDPFLQHASRPDAWQTPIVVYALALRTLASDPAFQFLLANPWDRNHRRGNPQRTRDATLRRVLIENGLSKTHARAIVPLVSPS
jgi:hypothetical protein